MAQLGSPYEYEAYICDSATGDKIYRVPWSQIRWQRVRNNVSVGSVFVAEADRGSRCCGLLEVLFPWSRMLRVERNGRFAWDGPVTGWGRSPAGAGDSRGVTVRAHDRAAITFKRLLGVTRDITDETSAILVQILNDSGIGTAIDPYSFVLPTAVGTTGLDIKKEYRVDRLQRAFDEIGELLELSGVFFTQYLDRMVINEGTVRDSLGLATERPRLNEATTDDLPGFDVDGLEMCTSAFVGGSSQGQSSHAFVGQSSYWAGEYLSSTLERGRSDSRIVTQNDADAAAVIDATRYAAPKFSLEQVALSPLFGGPHMNKDLSNLLPGALVDIDFADTCGFDVPALDIAVVLHDLGGGSTRWLPTPLQSSSVRTARIEQIDVTVDMTDQGMVEDFRLSAFPYIEWSGERVPADWPWTEGGGVP